MLFEVARNNPRIAAWLCTLGGSPAGSVRKAGACVRSLPGWPKRALSPSKVREGQPYLAQSIKVMLGE